MRIGRYEVLSILGQGAFGEVFHARLAGPMGFRKDVAIKRIHPHLVRGNQQVVELLIDEARLGGLLRHPNIVESHEFQQEEGAWFLTMEYVDGLTLGELLDHASIVGRLLPHALALELVEQICRGLDYAHNLQLDGEGLGVVHRDLKPANIMLSRDGVVKIMDFGMAKAGSNIRQSTMTGTAKGTPAYMSPEQVRGSKRVTAASDIFAVGVILYELVTQGRVFEGDSTVAIMFSVVAGVPQDVIDHFEEMLPGGGPILARAVAKDPSERWPSAGEFGRAIRALRDALPEPADTTRATARALFDGIEALDPEDLRARTDDFRSFVFALGPVLQEERRRRDASSSMDEALSDVGEPPDGVAALVDETLGDPRPTATGLDDTADVAGLDDTADVAGLDDTADVAGLDDTADVAGLDDTADVAGLDDTADVAGLGDTADVAGLDDTADVAGLADALPAPVVDDTVDVAAPSQAVSAPIAAPEDVVDPSPPARRGSSRVVLGIAVAASLAVGGVWLGSRGPTPEFDSSEGSPAAQPRESTPEVGAESGPTPPEPSPTPSPTPEAGPEPTPRPAAGPTPAPVADAAPTPEATPPEAPRGQGTGLLVVRSSPWGWASVDGGAEQKTPLRLDALPAGRHKVEVRCGECSQPASKTFDIDLAPDGREIIRAEFEL